MEFTALCFLEDRRMLTFQGHTRPNTRAGVSRRDFLTLGTLGFGGLSLANLLQLQADGAVAPATSAKSVIMI
jgi:hypothetical protein